MHIQCLCIFQCHSTNTLVSSRCRISFDRLRWWLLLVLWLLILWRECYKIPASNDFHDYCYLDCGIVKLLNCHLTLDRSSRDGSGSACDDIELKFSNCVWCACVCANAVSYFEQHSSNGQVHVWSALQQNWQITVRWPFYHSNIHFAVQVRHMIPLPSSPLSWRCTGKKREEEW